MLISVDWFVVGWRNYLQPVVCWQFNARLGLWLVELPSAAAVIGRNMDNFQLWVVHVVICVKKELHPHCLYGFPEIALKELCPDKNRN